MGNLTMEVCPIGNPENEGGNPSHEISLEAKNSSPDCPRKDVLKLTSYDHKELIIMAANSKEKSSNLAWVKDFKEHSSEHSFLLSFAGKYPLIDHVRAFDITKNAHERRDQELNNIRCIEALISSRDEKFLEMYSTFVRKLIEESNAELELNLSCGKCFLYDNHSRQSFDSVVTCLKEFARIVKEIETVKNKGKDKTKNFNGNNSTENDNLPYSKTQNFYENTFKNGVISVHNTSRRDMKSKVTNYEQNDLFGVSAIEITDSNKSSQLKNLSQNLKIQNASTLNKDFVSSPSQNRNSFESSQKATTENHTEKKTVSQSTINGFDSITTNLHILRAIGIKSIEGNIKLPNSESNKIKHTFDEADKSLIQSGTNNVTSKRDNVSNVNTKQLQTSQMKSSSITYDNDTNNSLPTNDETNEKTENNNLNEMKSYKDKKMTKEDNNIEKSSHSGSKYENSNSPQTIGESREDYVYFTAVNKDKANNKAPVHNQNFANLPVNETNVLKPIQPMIDECNHTSLACNQNLKEAKNSLSNEGDENFNSIAYNAMPTTMDHDMFTTLNNTNKKIKNELEIAKIDALESIIIGMSQELTTHDFEYGSKFSDKREDNNSAGETKVHDKIHSTTNKDSFVSYHGKNIPRNESERNGIKTIEIGTKTTEKKGKVVLLLGSSGSGKTSLINLCANFYFGAQTADEEKLFIIESKGKTDKVTIYSFYPDKEPQIPVTMIDTPGLNDSTGAEIHDHVNDLKLFFANACFQGLEINAIGFVGQSHLVRLTSSERLVMNFIKTFFGVEGEHHVVALVTFSDSDQTPCFINAMDNYGFKEPTFFKFNNTLLIRNVQGVEPMDKLIWIMGKRSWKNFLKHLNTMNSIPFASVYKIRNDVFNKEIVDNYKNNLIVEVRILCNMSLNNIEKLYCNKELHLRRKRVWRAATTTYNITEGNSDITKEVFLMEFCQLHFCQRCHASLFSICMLFLLMDDESAMQNSLMRILTALLKCNEFANTIVSNIGDKCVGPPVSQKGGSFETNNVKFKTVNQCVIYSDSIRIQIFKSALQLIKNEISKYSPKFVSWDLMPVFNALVCNERTKGRDIIHITHITKELLKVCVR